MRDLSMSPFAVVVFISVLFSRSSRPMTFTNSAADSMIVCLRFSFLSGLQTRQGPEQRAASVALSVSGSCRSAGKRMVRCNLQSLQGCAQVGRHNLQPGQAAERVYSPLCLCVVVATRILLLIRQTANVLESCAAMLDSLCSSRWRRGRNSCEIFYRLAVETSRARPKGTCCLK